jgi:hypothetical protein
LQPLLDNAADLHYTEQLRTALVAYHRSPNFTGGEVAQADLQPWIEEELPIRQAVRHCHSRTPELGAKYLQRVQRQLAQ